MNVGWSVVEMGNAGSDQLLHGRDGLDDSDDLGGLDVTTAEVPAFDRPRTSVLADDDGSRGAGGPEAAISISLETNEVPFQQPNLQSSPVDPARRDWRAAVADVGKWPLVALGAATILVAAFALFISGNGRSLSGDGESVEAPLASESVSAAVAADQIAGAPARAELGTEPLTAGDESDDPSGRSTGALGPGEGSGFFSGQVVEPDRSLTGTDVDWTPATVASTIPPTATTATSEASSTTATDATTPPTTATTTESTTPTTAEPAGPWVRALGPGTGDESNPAVVSGRVTLEAQGSDEFMRYRFFVHVRTDKGRWRQVERSRWRFDPRWTINTGTYEGLTIRWTVVGLTGFRNQTDESAPLYLQVGGGGD